MKKVMRKDSGEVYDVLNEMQEYYLLKSVRGHNTWYHKDDFTIVKDSKVMTYIGDDCGYLTNGKNYNVDHFNDALYRVIADNGRERAISKERFIEPSTVAREFDTKLVKYDLHKWLKCNNLVLSEDRPVSTQQVGGTHYTDMNVQPFDFIEANKLTFFEGNVVKYLSRYKSKDGNRDIDKAIHYVKESFNRLGDFQSRDIEMTAEEYCKANNLPPVVELVLCWILEYPVSVSLELIVKLLEELKS